MAPKNTAKKMCDHLTMGHVAKATGVAPKTAAEWVDTGMLPGHRIPTARGRKDRRVMLRDLIDFSCRHGIPVVPGFADEVVVAYGVPFAQTAANSGVVFATDPVGFGRELAFKVATLVIIGDGDGASAAVRIARQVRQWHRDAKLILVATDLGELSRLWTPAIDEELGGERMVRVVPAPVDWEQVLLASIRRQFVTQGTP